MASLYDLAMQYLGQSLPDISGIFNTSQAQNIVAPQEEEVVDGVTEELLYPQNVQRGGDNFNVYNPDMTQIRTDYSPYSFRRAQERDFIGDLYSSETEMNKLMSMYPEYYQGKQLTGIPGAIAAYAKNSLPGRILGGVANIASDILPVNRRAILENQARGLGIYTDNIGRVVAGPGDINTAQNIMAGYNLAKIDADTFAKRRNMINKYMKDKAQKEAKLKALAEAEALILGDAKDRTTKVIRDKNIEKDTDRGVDVQKSSKIQSSTSGLGSIGSGGGGRDRDPAPSAPTNVGNPFGYR